MTSWWEYLAAASLPGGRIGSPLGGDEEPPASPARTSIGLTELPGPGETWPPTVDARRARAVEMMAQAEKPSPMIPVSQFPGADITFEPTPGPAVPRPGLRSVFASAAPGQRFVPNPDLVPTPAPLPAAEPVDSKQSELAALAEDISRRQARESSINWNSLPLSPLARPTPTGAVPGGFAMPGVVPSPEGSWGPQETSGEAGPVGKAQILMGPNGVPMLTNQPQLYPGMKPWSGASETRGSRGKDWLAEHRGDVPSWSVPQGPVDVSMAALEGRRNTARLLGEVRRAEAGMGEDQAVLREADQQRAIDAAARAAKLQEAQTALAGPEELSLREAVDIAGLQAKKKALEVTPEEAHRWRVAEQEARQPERIPLKFAVYLIQDAMDPNGQTGKIVRRADAWEAEAAATGKTLATFIAETAKTNPAKAAEMQEASYLKQQLKASVDSLVALQRGKPVSSLDDLSALQTLAQQTAQQTAAK